MGVDARHPLYDDHKPDWDQMRVTYEGERQVKKAGFVHLPPTSGMVEDNVQHADTAGAKAYEAYRTRSRFPDIVREAVEALLGVMHHKPATIELPDKMEFLMTKATRRNESLLMLLRRVNEQQLVLGRVGILADVIDKGPRKGEPYLSIHHGERVINWDEGRTDGVGVHNLNLVSIDETEVERVEGFNWKEEQKFRLLLLTKDESEEAALEAADPPKEPVENLPEGEGVYRMGVFRDTGTEFAADKLITPSISGKNLTKIPFVFVNTKDVVPDPDDPPLLGLSSLTLAIYRGEADYRQALFQQGQDTLVVIGHPDADAEHRVGAGASINITSTEGDAKYIGVDSQGLPEMRISLENDYERAGKKGGQLLDTVGGDQQSGEALRVRVAAKTATLNQIALAGAFALEQILKIVAEWLGLNPDQVVVVPNLDFADDRVSAKEIVDLVSAKTMGAQISHETIHEIMQERGLTKIPFAEERERIDKEEEEGIGVTEAGSSNPEGPEGELDPEQDPDGQTADEPELETAAAE